MKDYAQTICIAIIMGYFILLVMNPQWSWQVLYPLFMALGAFVAKSSLGWD